MDIDKLIQCDSLEAYNLRFSSLMDIDKLIHKNKTFGFSPESCGGMRNVFFFSSFFHELCCFFYFKPCARKAAACKISPGGGRN